MLLAEEYAMADKHTGEWMKCPNPECQAEFDYTAHAMDGEGKKCPACGHPAPWIGMGDDDHECQFDAVFDGESKLYIGRRCMTCGEWQGGEDDWADASNQFLNRDTTSVKPSPTTKGNEKTPYPHTYPYAPIIHETTYRTAKDASKAFAELKDLIDGKQEFSILEEAFRDLPAHTLLGKIVGDLKLPKLTPVEQNEAADEMLKRSGLGIKTKPFTLGVKFDDVFSDHLKAVGERMKRMSEETMGRALRGKYPPPKQDDPEPDQVLSFADGGVQEVDGPWPGARAWEWPSGGSDQWGEGAWEDEPDKVQWIDGESGLHCIILRAGVDGSLNGYVAVHEGHPCHGHDLGHRRPLVDEDEFGPAIWAEGEEPDSRGPGCRSSCLGQDIELHNALNFAGPSVDPVDQDEEGRSRCLAGDITSGSHWWFGFDNGHAGDGTPAMHRASIAGAWSNNWPYRDVVFVGRECVKLARQLAEIEREERQA